MEIIPLFKSQYSIGRSILTLEKESSSEKGPDSIIDICKNNNLSSFFLIDDSMSGFLQGHVNSLEANLKMIFGLRISVCPDITKKDPDSLDKTCKYIIIAKNTNGYKRLIKLYSASSLNGFYYTPRADFKLISSFWNNKDLQLVAPFYDSFLHKNHAGNQSGKFHLKISLVSKELKQMKRIDSDKKIYKILNEELKKYIHSIQILIN